MVRKKKELKPAGLELQEFKKNIEHRCSVCGRPITLQESIDWGCGKKCRRKLEKKQQTNLEGYF